MPVTRQIHQEAELIERFVGVYRRRFDKIIDQLNGPTQHHEPQTMRLCVEAINMMLSTQGQLASVLRQLSHAAPAKAA
jgi:hypothetical protein